MAEKACQAFLLPSSSCQRTLQAVPHSPQQFREVAVQASSLHQPAVTLQHVPALNAGHHGPHCLHQQQIVHDVFCPDDEYTLADQTFRTPCK